MMAMEPALNTTLLVSELITLLSQSTRLLALLTIHKIQKVAMMPKIFSLALTTKLVLEHFTLVTIPQLMMIVETTLIQLDSKLLIAML